MDGVPVDAVRAVLRRNGFRVREATDPDGTRFVYGDRHQYTKLATLLHPSRADPVPRRRRRHVAAGRGAGPRRRRGRIADRPADRDARAAPRQEPRVRGARLRDRARRPTSRPTWPSTRTARRSRARRSGSTIRCRSPATRSTRTASGRRRTSSCATPPGRRLWDAPVPMTDAAGRVALRHPRRPGPRHGPEAAARRAADGAGVVIVIPYRIVGTAADGQPIEELYAAVDLHLGDTQGFAGPRPVDRARRLRRVHAAHRQARSGPGPGLARFRPAHRRASRSRSTGRAAGSGRASRPMAASGSSGARTATSTSSGSSAACSTSSSPLVAPPERRNVNARTPAGPYGAAPNGTAVARPLPLPRTPHGEISTQRKMHNGGNPRRC